MNRRVVVTGMGIISCLGNDVDNFWKNVREGVCGLDRITEFPVDNLVVKIGGKIKNFHPEDFGMDKPFIRKQDNFTLFAMAAAKQAMDDSGLKAGQNIDNYRLGVNVSSGIGGFSVTFREVAKMLETPSGEWVSPNFVPTTIPNIAAGHIATAYQAYGPCMNIVSACATSTHALGEAYRTIKHGYADAIISGGSDHCTIPMGLAGFASCRALSREADPKRASLPFNAKRGGFVLSDGAAVLVLEEYEHAKARGARIYAEIVGYGATCDAYHATAPRPDGSTQAECIRQACREAGFDPSKDCVYVNAHGTGTVLNDITETRAYKIAFGDFASRLHISSSKSMHGHMMGAAGAAEAIVTIKAIENSTVPPTINLDEQDPECDLNYTPNKAVNAGITLGISDSFGFGGANGCIAFRKV
ncbi:MAG: beta-ketoacyl-ACP synthase II [Bacteroidales bacterium]|nr:beta-ketoacyl-ACP synthase II [Bacteroidales bacterium]